MAKYTRAQNVDDHINAICEFESNMPKNRKTWEPQEPYVVWSFQKHRSAKRHRAGSSGKQRNNTYGLTGEAPRVGSRIFLAPVTMRVIAKSTSQWSGMWRNGQTDTFTHILAVPEDYKPEKKPVKKLTLSAAGPLRLGAPKRTIGHSHRRVLVEVRRRRILPQEAQDNLKKLRDKLERIRQLRENLKKPLEGAVEMREVEKDTFVPEPETAGVERYARVKQRTGQHSLRQHMLSRKPTCPFTGVENPRMLKTSHIKPNRHCGFYERDGRVLHEKDDGANVLMLTPNADWLFDQGYVSFTEEGKLMRSMEITGADYRAMGLSHDASIEHLLDGPVGERRQGYMEHHRRFIFRGPSKEEWRG